MHQIHCPWQILKDIFLYADLGNLSRKDLVHRIVITDMKCINDQGKANSFFVNLMPCVIWWADRSILDDKGLLHIAEVIDFSSFTTLQVEHFFAGMRTPSRPTRDMHTRLCEPAAKLHHWVASENLSFFLRCLQWSSKSLNRKESAQKRTWMALWTL